MKFIPVSVESYCGYKADEYPRRFVWDGVDFEICDILDRWYEGYQNSESPAVHYFRVKTDLKGSFLLRHETPDNKWYLVV